MRLFIAINFNDDIKEELNMMRYYESNKAAVLQDVRVSRFDIMD